jgi:type VI secretion system secreted protein Hcp
MATDIFLKLGSISGDSLDEKHKGEIEVYSFSWGESADVLPPAGSGRASAGALQLSTLAGSASVPIFLACARADLIAGATLTVRRAGGSQMEYLHIALGPLHVANYQVSSAHGQDAASESFALVAGRFTITYTPQHPDGSPGSPITGSFDFVKHAQV